MTMTETCLSDLELDVLLAVEFPAASDERGHIHVAGCARCAARLRELEHGRAAFQAMELPFEGPRSGAARARPRRWLGWRSLGVTGTLAAAALGVATVTAGGASGWGSNGDAPSQHDGADETAQLGGVRLKGGPQLALFIGHEGHMREAGDLEPVYADDQLQFAYSSADAGYVTVLSRDGAGLVSVYVPSEARVAWPAPAGERRLLPESTILDGTLGREQLYALFCGGEIELAPLSETLREHGTLEAPENCSMRRIELDKRARP
jgi:hypothetical protein